jgi:hypothetical protein
VLAGAVALVFPWVTVQACGPDFQPDVFVQTTHPDDLHTFAAGKLGILQTGYDSNEYAVAYRYLSGGVLSKEEQAAYAPAAQVPKDWTKMTPEQIQTAQQADSDATAVGTWITARQEWLAAAGVQDTGAKGLPNGNDYYSPEQSNCPDPAFRNAVLTGKGRAAAWGGKSPLLVDWIHGQDAVFSNCDGKTPGTPAAAPADAPALLRADRAYQVAAALFYAAKFDDARAAFEAIGRDAGSPWHAWGGYLAARAAVREAFGKGKPADEYSPDLADFDKPTMQRAQEMLEKLLAHPPEGLSREAVERELNFVRIRTEPDKRAAEICAALAGPRPDAHLQQDLKDLDFILYKHLKLASTPPLLEWIGALRQPDSEGAVKQWQSTPTMPWLVVAVMQADAKGAGTAALMAAAAKVKAGDPAFETVVFHRVRILTDLRRDDEARALVDSVLQTKTQAGSERNAYLSERMGLARSFEEMLTYAPRTVMDAESQGFSAAGANCSIYTEQRQKPARCVSDEHALEFDEDAVMALNEQTPLSRLVEAAESQKLPQNLRDEVAMAAWTRSVLLDDAASAAKLSPLLPEKLRKTAGTSIGFPATLALLRDPGLRPVVEAGFSRLESYDSRDEFRDNWWCGPASPNEGQEQAAQKRAEPAAYFSGDERAKGKAEFDEVTHVAPAPVFMGKRAIDYAEAHPDDPDVAEALALTVRATRFGCVGGAAENTATSKAAFQLLHAKYPKSPWAVKTKHYY